MEVIGTQVGLSQREKLWLLKRRLGQLYRNPQRVYRLNSREASETGRQYTDEAIDAGEIVCSLGRCTLRQQDMLFRWLGPRSAGQDRIARDLGVSVITVKRDVAAALRRMAAMVWEEEV